MEAWKEAMLQLESISSGFSSFPTPPAVSSQRPNDKGPSWDNPLADGATVKLFDPPQKSFEGPLQKKPPPELPDPDTSIDPFIESLESRGKSSKQIQDERAANKDKAITMDQFLEYLEGKV